MISPPGHIDYVSRSNEFGRLCEIFYLIEAGERSSQKKDQEDETEDESSHGCRDQDGRSIRMYVTYRLDLFGFGWSRLLFFDFRLVFVVVGR